jgi:translocator protein
MGIGDIVDAFDGELLALFLFGTYFVAGIGTALSPQIAPVYRTDKRPCCSPPYWLFGPVWAILYTLSGVAAYLVRIEGGAWTSGENGNLAALVVYSVLQLVLTTYIIFGARRYFIAASIVIFISLVLAITTVVLFAFLDTLAAVFMGALSGWITYALYLQVSVAYLNRSEAKKDRDARGVNAADQNAYANADMRAPPQNYPALRGAQIRR